MQLKAPHQREKNGLIYLLVFKMDLRDRKHLFEIKDQTASLFFNLSVCLQILDINSKITIKNPSIRNEMLQNHPRRLLHRPHHK